MTEYRVEQVMKRNIISLAQVEEAIKEAIQSGKELQDLQTGQDGDSRLMGYLSFLDTALERTQHMRDYYMSLLRAYHKEWIDKFMMNTLYAPPEIIDEMVLEKLMDGVDSEETDYSDVKTEYPDLYMESPKPVNRTIPDITMREVYATRDAMSEKSGTSTPVDRSKK